MKRIIMSVLVLSVFSLALFGAKKSGVFDYIPYDSASWSSETIIEGPEGEHKYSQDVMYKNKKMRSEGILEDPQTGEKMKQVSIMTEKNIYVIYPEKKTGMKYSMEKSNSPHYGAVKAAEARSKAKKVGSGKVGRVSCDIYVYRLENEGLKVQEWRSRKDGFIMKSITAGEQVTTTTIVSSLKKNPKIPDSNFTVPKNIKMTDMTKIMSRIGSYSSGGEEDSPEEMQDAVQEMMKGFFGE